MRPHPRQNIELVKNRFKKNLSNIKVIYEGVITPWIDSCELYIHSGCTSFLEAASLQKKIIYVYENEDYKSSKMYKAYGYYFSSYKKCLNFLCKKIEKKNFQINRSVKPITIISNSKNKKYFYKDFIKFIKKNYDNKLQPIKSNYLNKTKIGIYFGAFKILIKKLFLKVQFLRQILFLINPNLLLTKEYKEKKFPSLFKNELKNYLNRITTKKFKIIKLSDNLFLIKKINLS